jgi:50S ribosomal protein L16 3-hydroxylase
MTTHDKSGMFSNCSLTSQQFLTGYWQKKPLLIPQAFPGFEPELDAGDIAGLACEELAESRLVTGSYPEHDWQMRYGPFTEEDFTGLPESAWTLLVQDVEKHYPPLTALMRAFDFIPRWRIDDLMVSVAGPGGSVGPHVDQYDVFLIQAEGRRTWQIAGSFDEELLQDCELNVLQSFIAEQQWTLNPGDMLYLPPGVAHHGVAQDRGMTWSVGMRAPSTADLFQAYGEWAAGQPGDGGRYRDPDLTVASGNGEISSAALARFKTFFLSGAAADSPFDAFLGTFLSNYRLAHEPAPPDTTYDPPVLAKTLRQNGVLRHNPWTRLLWLETETAARLYAAGSEFSCTAALAESICDPERLAGLGALCDETELSLLCDLLNRGHLYVEQL